MALEDELMGTSPEMRQRILQLNKPFPVETNCVAIALYLAGIRPQLDRVPPEEIGKFVLDLEAIPENAAREGDLVVYWTLDDPRRSMHAGVVISNTGGKPVVFSQNGRLSPGAQPYFRVVDGGPITITDFPLRIPTEPRYYRVKAPNA